jgi:hypothetical protein
MSVSILHEAVGEPQSGSASSVKGAPHPPTEGSPAGGDPAALFLRAWQQQIEAGHAGDESGLEQLLQSTPGKSGPVQYSPVELSLNSPLMVGSEVVSKADFGKMFHSSQKADALPYAAEPKPSQQVLPTQKAVSVPGGLHQVAMGKTASAPLRAMASAKTSGGKASTGTLSERNSDRLNAPPESPQNHVAASPPMAFALAPIAVSESNSQWKSDLPGLPEVGFKSTTDVGDHSIGLPTSCEGTPPPVQGSPVPATQFSSTGTGVPRAMVQVEASTSARVSSPGSDVESRSMHRSSAVTPPPTAEGIRLALSDARTSTPHSALAPAWETSGEMALPVKPPIVNKEGLKSSANLPASRSTNATSRLPGRDLQGSSGASNGSRLVMNLTVQSGSPVHEDGRQSLQPGFPDGAALPDRTGSDVHSAPSDLNLFPGPSPSPDVFHSIDHAADLPSGAWIHADTRRAEAGYLDPSLGWISVRAEAVEGGLHATLVPTSDATAQFLGSHMSGLHVFLSECQMQHATVVLAGSDQRSNGFTASADSQGTGQGSPGGDRGTNQSPTPGAAVLDLGIAAKLEGINTSGLAQPHPLLAGEHISVMA